MDLAEAWLLRLTQAYNGEPGAAAPECHPQLPQHIELQRAVLDRLQGDDVASEQRLQALERHAREVGAPLLGLIAMTQQIGLLLSQTRRDEARELLLRSLQSAAGGALIPFKTLLGEHSQWLHEQLLQLPSCKVREALLEELPASCTPTLEPAHGSDCLSVRELGVLHLIAQGCSNQEISEQLFISLHTVKTHASHINSKLGVERRTQAVARAKVLGLLG